MTDQNLYCWLGADLWLGSVGGQRRQGGEDFVRAAQVGAGSDVEIESRAGSIPQRQPRPVRAHDLQRSIGLRRGVDGAVVRVFDEDPHRGLRRIDQLNPREYGYPLTVNLTLPAAVHFSLEVFIQFRYENFDPRSPLRSWQRRWAKGACIRRFIGHILQRTAAGSLNAPQLI